MADNIVDSLFGPQPWQIQQQQNQRMQDFAHQQAQMNAAQRSVQAMTNAGGMLAGAGMEAAGYQNPAMAQAERQRSVMNTGGDMSTAAGLKAKAAEFAAAGDQQTAMKLVLLSRQMEAEDSKRKLEEAHAKYYEKGGASSGAGSKAIRMQAVLRAATEASLNMPAEQRDEFIMNELQRASDLWDRDAGITPMPSQGMPKPQIPQPASPQAPMPISTSNDTPTQLSPVSQIASPEGAMSPQMLQAIRADMQTRGDTQGASVLPASQRPFAPTKAQSAGEIELAKTIAKNNPEAKAAGSFADKGGELSVASIDKQEGQVKVAEDALRKLNQLEVQLQKGDTTTGIAADFRKATNKMLALLGGREGARKATETEIADVMMGSDVFPMIQSLGIGARGMDTPEERRFMRSVLTGDISLEKNTLLEMTRMRKEAMQREIDRWNTAVDKGTYDPYFKIPGKEKKKYGGSAPTATRRYNPVTGKIE